MIDAENVVLVLLAAGQSSRFGMQNKLEAEFLGKPVGFHVTTALESIPFADRIVVTDGCQTTVVPGARVTVTTRPPSGRALAGSNMSSRRV